MIDDFPKLLEAWHDFYLVVGTGAAALTGLLFVIVSLGPRVVAPQANKGVRGFVSPIATHFTTVLVASSIMLVPGLPPSVLGGFLLGGGCGGIVYTAWTRVHQLWRANNLSVLDWIWFAAMPVLCFALIAAAGALITMGVAIGLYVIAGSTLLLTVVAIRNAWDIVLWVAKRQPELEKKARRHERLR
jgi:hypothetical protein